MKVCDLMPYIYDKVKIYVVDSDDLNTIYEGLLNNAPDDILNRKVDVIGAMKNIVDIGVKDEDD